MWVRRALAFVVIFPQMWHFVLIWNDKINMNPMIVIIFIYRIKSLFSKMFSHLIIFFCCQIAIGFSLSIKWVNSTDMSSYMAFWWKCPWTAWITAMISLAFVYNFDMLCETCWSSKYSIATFTFVLFIVNISFMYTELLVRSKFSGTQIATEHDIHMICLHVVGKILLVVEWFTA